MNATKIKRFIRPVAFIEHRYEEKINGSLEGANVKYGATFKTCEN